MLDYNISHQVLLFRNTSGGEKNENVDLIFETVFYLDIPTRLTDIELYPANEDDKKTLLNKYNNSFYPEFGQNVIVVESGNKKYFIGCNRVLVKENNLDPLNSSIK